MLEIVYSIGTRNYRVKMESMTAGEKESELFYNAKNVVLKIVGGRFSETNRKNLYDRICDLSKD